MNMSDLEQRVEMVLTGDPYSDPRGLLGLFRDLAADWKVRGAELERLQRSCEYWHARVTQLLADKAALQAKLGADDEH